MSRSPFFFSLLLALPLAATAQTKPATSQTQQVTETVEDLDPATGKVIRRTTRTTTVPVGTAPAGTASKTAVPTDEASYPTGVAAASDAAVSDFYREKTTVSKLTASELLSAYNRFMEKVRSDRRSWNAATWDRAAAVLSALNGRYEQLRSSFTLDDKVTIRSQQAEFQALRTARQVTEQLSDKL